MPRRDYLTIHCIFFDTRYIFSNIFSSQIIELLGHFCLQFSLLLSRLQSLYQNHIDRSGSFLNLVQTNFGYGKPQVIHFRFDLINEVIRVIPEKFQKVRRVSGSSTLRGRSRCRSKEQAGKTGPRNAVCRYSNELPILKL